MKEKTILLAEDDFNLGTVIKNALNNAGYITTHVMDGEHAFKTFLKGRFDVCLLDIVMPRLNGFDLAARIRRTNDWVPIIFLTSKWTDEDRIAGFRAGADGWVTKPFCMQELLLRIEVFVRRCRTSRGSEVRFVLGRLVFDYSEMTLTDTITGKIVTITEKANELLRFFCENTDKTIKREEILSRFWGKDDFFASRSMDVFINKMRNYLQIDPTLWLETVHGVGYKLHTNNNAGYYKRF